MSRSLLDSLTRWLLWARLYGLFSSAASSLINSFAPVLDVVFLFHRVSCIGPDSLGETVRVSDFNFVTPPLHPSSYPPGWVHRSTESVQSAGLNFFFFSFLSVDSGGSRTLELENQVSSQSQSLERKRQRRREMQHWNTWKLPSPAADWKLAPLDHRRREKLVTEIANGRERAQFGTTGSLRAPPTGHHRQLQPVTDQGAPLMARPSLGR